MTTETAAPAEQDFDLSAAIDAVGEKVGGADPGEQGSQSQSATEPPPVLEDDIPLPKAWKKEMEAHWRTAPRELRQYAQLREADVSRGIQMYRDGHERWNKLMTPYQEVLQQYPDVDPGALLNGLMQSHLRLTFGTADEKKAMVQQLLQAYGVELGEAQAAAAAAVPPEYNQRLAALERTNAESQRRSVMQHVETFFADPKNEFAKDVADDILGLVQKGHTLEESYSLAIWQNPATRAKLIAKEQAAAATSAAKLNVGGDPTAPVPAPRKGTMEDTMKAVISKHFSNVNL
jgi:ATP-dependent exoDNAse (exonuclease V) beta subunit